MTDSAKTPSALRASDWIVSLAAAITVIVCAMTFAATLVAAHNHAQRELEHRWILPKEDRPRVIPDDNEIKVVSAERERLGKTLAGRLA